MFGSLDLVTEPASGGDIEVVVVSVEVIWVEVEYDFEVVVCVY